MNEEVKEIMNRFDNILKHYELDIKFGQLSIESICHLFPNEVISIKDYITNLQNENEDLKDRLKVMEHFKNSLQEENQRLSVELNQNMIERNNYISRCEKAIEYINNHQPVFSMWNKKQISKWFDEEFYKELLDILNGD